MGGIGKYFEIEATSPQEAYKKIIKSEKERYGSGPYNGSALHCSFGNRKMSFSKYSEKNEREIDEYINSVGGGEKCQLDYCDAGITGYLVTTVEKVVVKHGTPKSVYKVFQKNDEGNLYVIGEFYDKLKAVEYAERYVLDHPDCNSKWSCPIVIRRRTEYSNGENEDLYRFDTKTSKVDKSFKAKKGQSVTALRKYIFFGYAPY